MSTLFFANGDLEEGAWLSRYLEQANQIVAVDGGLRHVERIGCRPDLLIGDLDSIDSSQLTGLETDGCEIIRFPAEKDETDLELALLVVMERFPEPIVIVGAFGGRLDQHLANILLLTHIELGQREVKLAAPFQEMWIIRDVAEINGCQGDTISLVPLAGDVQMKATEGLKWPLLNEVLKFGPARGISNVMTGERARVEINSGQLLCIHTDGQWER